MKNLPKFVKLGSIALRLSGKIYYRDGGDWSVGYKVVDGVLLSWCKDKDTPWLHKKPLIEISEKEWRDNNGKYAPILIDEKKEEEVDTNLPF